MVHDDPANEAGHPRGEANTESTRRARRDRHGRRERSTITTSATGPRKTTGPDNKGPDWTVGPPKTVPMTAEDYRNAVQAWTVLISSWWTLHPPEHDEHN